MEMGIERGDDEGGRKRQILIGEKGISYIPPSDNPNHGPVHLHTSQGKCKKLLLEPVKTESYCFLFYWIHILNIINRQMHRIHSGIGPFTSALIR